MQKEIRALTGLRGVAAVFVAVYHFGHYIPDRQIHWAIHKGYLCVDLFFVLSGFVMATTYRKLFSEAVSASDFGRFMWLRVARIWPLFVVATLFAFLVHGATNWQLFTNLLMVQGWGLGASIDPPLWSVSAEFLAYLVFPWLFLAIIGADGKRLALIVAAGGIALLVGGMLAAKNAGSIDLVGSYANTGAQLARCLISFTMGVIAWKLAQDRQITAVTNTTSFGLICAGTIGALFVVNANDVLICALFPALVLSVAQDKGAVARILATRGAHWFGVLSFAIYALQSPYYELTEPYLASAATHLPGGVSTAFYYAGAAMGLLALSVAAHYLVEKPCRLALRALSGARRKPAIA